MASESNVKEQHAHNFAAEQEKRESIKMVGATLLLGFGTHVKCIVTKCDSHFSRYDDCVVLFLPFHMFVLMLHSPFLLLDVLALIVCADGITTTPNKYRLSHLISHIHITKSK